MKTTLTIALALAMLSATAQTNPRSSRVSSYNKKDGTHVDSYQRTKSNKTEKDNYSASGNTNSFTGKKGGKTPKK